MSEKELEVLDIRVGAGSILRCLIGDSKTQREQLRNGASHSLQVWSKHSQTAVRREDSLQVLSH